MDDRCDVILSAADNHERTGAEVAGGDTMRAGFGATPQAHDPASAIIMAPTMNTCHATSTL